MPKNIRQLLFTSMVIVQYSPPNQSKYFKIFFAASFVAASTLLLESKIHDTWCFCHFCLPNHIACFTKKPEGMFFECVVWFFLDELDKKLK
jgi:hypothetical protein